MMVRDSTLISLCHFSSVIFPKLQNKGTCTIRIKKKIKSQIKIPHFFPAPQKLFLLIVLFNDFTSYRDSFFKRINKNNFCGAGKKWGIYICDLKNTYRTCTLIQYFGVRGADFYNCTTTGEKTFAFRASLQY